MDPRHAPDTSQPSVIQNVHVIGQVFVTNHPDSLVADSFFEGALTERRPRWLPVRVASWLRGLVTEPTTPLLTGLLPKDDA